MAGATLNPVLRDFWTKPARNRVLHGGRASSKSWDAAGFAIFLANSYKVKFLCTRQLQNKIEDSVYSLLKVQIDRFGLRSRFQIQKNKIINTYTGSEFVFYGLWRHIDQIKSFEGADICWIEEAHGLTKNQWDILEPTVRKDGSQFWIIFNPNLVTDFVYQRFVTNPPPDTIVRQINYTQNGFLSDTMLKVIEAAKEEDYEEYQHIYLGVPRNDDDGAIIKRSWVEAAKDAHKVIDADWSGPGITGYDVADSGDDYNAIAILAGPVCTYIEEWKGRDDELFESAKHVRDMSKIFGSHSIGYDSIGVGASTGSHLKNLNWSDHWKFNAAASVHKPDLKYKDTKITNADFFANLKAQAWWQLSERFRNTYLAKTKGRVFKACDMISLSNDIDPKLLDKLVTELSTPKRDFDTLGRVKVESKKDLAKREIPSPNLADAFVIAVSKSLVKSGSIKDML